MWQKLAISTAIEVVPKLVTEVINLFKEQEPVKKKRKPTCKVVITKEDFEYIMEEYVSYKAGDLVGIRTQEDFTKYINTHLNMNKSRTWLFSLIKGHTFK